MISDSSEATRVATRAAWISLAGMAATAVLQIFIVAISGSVGLLADTIHNLGHLITTIPLIIAFRLGNRPPTSRFTYGLRRAEDLVGLFIGLVIAGSAALIFIDAFQALRHPRPMDNIGWVLAAAIIGALGNEIVAQYRIRAGRKVGSAALIAEGQHARTDALTSLAVIIGALGAMFGLPRLDALVGLFIGVMVVGVLMSSLRTVLSRLLDGIDPHTVADISSIAAKSVDVHEVKARWLGHELIVDIHAHLPENMTVHELQHLQEDVHHELKARFPRLEELRVVPIH
ncbi:cation diffusion facilitator family transporter [Corynebacterium sp. H130]|uniref:cation diffusion facilitator family transporter n=1 Tax=Corynebacterium sp. H130 TaxID=3133444 RepID=UPI00309F5E44